MKNIEKFCREKAIKYKKNELLAHYTTLRIGGRAELVAFPEEDNVLELVEVINNEGLPYYVIGAGSNLLIRDEGFKGVIINTRKMNKISSYEDNCYYVSSGVMLSGFLSFMAEKKLSGMEGLAGIPGTIGGAVKGNAGSFGYEIKDCIDEVEVITDKMEIRVLKKQDITFQYRSSGLPGSWIIRKARLRLKEDVDNQVVGRMKEFLKKKRNTQPLKERSAGCVFKNPEEQSAGYLIENAGLKGCKTGDIMVSLLHANYFINLGRGRASDFLRLVDIVKDKVLKISGIELELEIKIL